MPAGVEADTSAADRGVGQPPEHDRLLDYRPDRWRDNPACRDLLARRLVADDEQIQLAAVEQRQRHPRHRTGGTAIPASITSIWVGAASGLSNSAAPAAPVGDHRVDRDPFTGDHDAGLSWRKVASCRAPAARARSQARCISCPARSRCRPSAAATRRASHRWRSAAQVAGRASTSRVPARRGLAQRDPMSPAACAARRRGRARLRCGGSSGITPRRITPPWLATPTIERARARPAAGIIRASPVRVIAAGSACSAGTCRPPSPRRPSAVLAKAGLRSRRRQQIWRRRAVTARGEEEGKRPAVKNRRPASRRSCAAGSDSPRSRRRGASGTSRRDNPRGSRRCCGREPTVEPPQRHARAQAGSGTSVRR